jgi:nucleoside-diphosphate kinase
MANERTLAIIKPDALEKGVIGKIIDRIEGAGLKPVAMKLLRLTQSQAEGFYAVHRERPFFASLVKFMTDGPVVAMCLEGPNAVGKWREVMGATDPKKANAGTIRKDFATDVEKNSAHGSDSAENAVKEVAFFFSSLEIASYEWSRRG